MGIETVILVGLMAATAASQISSSKAQAQNFKANAASQAAGVRAEGELAAAEKSKEVRLRAARQTSSFITSGLELDGTPMDVLNETFDVGLADVNNITRNYKINASNIISQGNANASNAIAAGRTAAIKTVASGFAGAAGGMGGGASAGGSAGAMFGTQGTLNRAATFGSTSGIGPINGYGGTGYGN